MTIIEYNSGICKDTNVLGDNVYFDNGQGCGTIWFKDVTHAMKFLKKFGKISGADSGLCKKCSCGYSISEEGHDRYPEFACKRWKEEMKAKAKQKVKELKYANYWQVDSINKY